MKWLFSCMETYGPPCMYQNQNKDQTADFCFYLVTVRRELDFSP